MRIHAGGAKAKALTKIDSVDQGQRLEDRIRLDTVVVLAVTDDDFAYGNREIKIDLRGEYMRKQET